MRVDRIWLSTWMPVRWVSILCLRRTQNIHPFVIARPNSFGFSISWRWPRLPCRPVPLIYGQLASGFTEETNIPFLLLPWFLLLVHASVVRNRVTKHVLDRVNRVLRDLSDKVRDLVCCCTSGSHRKVARHSVNVRISDVSIRWWAFSVPFLFSYHSSLWRCTPLSWCFCGVVHSSDRQKSLSLLLIMGNKQVSASKDEHSVFVQGSMMTRTRSIRHQLEENQAHSHRRDKSYLPRMAPQGGGVVMPTMRDNQPHGGGGIESPQWGWYTNLTPPSPEMYTSNPFHKKHNISSTSTASTASDASAPMSHSCSKPNPVFQSLPSQRQKNQTGRHQPTLPV